MDGLAAAQAGSVPGFWILLIKTLGGLCLVLGVLMGFLYLLKYLAKPGLRKREKGMISLVSSFYLAPKERLHLMDVMGRKILIGVTAQGISRIAEFEDMDHEIVKQEDVSEQGGDASMFRNLITRISRETAGSDRPCAALNK